MAVDFIVNGQSVTTSSATTAPASGTSETWAVSALAAGFPTLIAGQTITLVDATSGATAAQQNEIIRATAGIAPGSTSITVTRGADGTTPVAHASASGFNVIGASSFFNRARTGVPDYAPEFLTGRYDKLRNFYRTSADTLAAFRQSAGAAVAGLKLCHAVILGDSHSAGYFGSTSSVPVDPLQAWPAILHDRLIASGLPSGGTGHVAFNSGMTGSDSRWTSTGWSRTNSGVLWGTSSTNASPATLALAGGGGVGVDILTVDFSANLSWSIKNSVGTVIDSGTTANGGTLTPRLISRTGLVDAASVTITTTGTGTSYLVSANIYKASGFILSNFALYGSQISGTNGWAQNALGYGYRQLVKAAVPNCDLLAVMLGGNDKVAGVTDAVISAAYTTVMNDWAGTTPPSKLIGGQWQAGGFSDTTWQTFIASLYVEADSLGIGMFDFNDRSGGYTAMNARGYMLDGGSATHPDRPIHADAGRAFADLLLS